MAAGKLYSKEQIQKLIAGDENWKSIEEALLPKDASLWDGNKKTPRVFKVVDNRSTHPDLGRVYTLRDLHTGDSFASPIDEVNANFRKFVPSAETKRLMQSASSIYKVLILVNGVYYPVPEPETPRKDEAIATAFAAWKETQQTVVVRDLTGGAIVLTLPDDADAVPPPTLPAHTVLSADVTADLRKRKAVKLSADLLVPGLIVKHGSSGDLFEFVRASPNDNTMLVFSDMKSGKEQEPVRNIIAESLYQAVVLVAADLTTVPSYPRRAYEAIVAKFGNLYEGTDVPAAGSPPPAQVVDVSGTSRRTVGIDAAKRNIVKDDDGKNRYVVRYKQKNWSSYREYEKSYKMQHHAEKRARELAAQKEVMWAYVIDTEDLNKSVAVYPPGADPLSDEMPGDFVETTYLVQFLLVSNEWHTYEKIYKSISAAEDRARKLVQDQAEVIRAEVFEQPANLRKFIVSQDNVDMRLYGIIDPETVDDLSKAIKKETVITPVEPKENPFAIPPMKQPEQPQSTHPRPPSPPPAPGGQTTLDSLLGDIKQRQRAPQASIQPSPISVIAPQATTERIEAVAAISKEPLRESVRDSLSKTTARKLIELSCVAIVSKYNISVAEASVICEENGEMLYEIADRLAAGEIDVYTAIQKIDKVMVDAYSLVDITQQPPEKWVFPDPKSEGVQDIEGMVNHAVSAKLKDLTNKRLSLVSQKTAHVTKDEVEEVAYELAFGKRKRRSAQHADVTLSWLSMGRATPEQVWKDYGIFVDTEQKGSPQSRFYVSLTTSGYVLSQDDGKSYPGKGFFGLVDRICNQYGADIITKTDRDRVDDNMLL